MRISTHLKLIRLKKVSVECKSKFLLITLSKGSNGDIDRLGFDLDFWTGKQKEVENEVDNTVKTKSKRKSNGVGGSGHKSKKQKKEEKPAKTAVQRSESPTSFFQGDCV